jgi:hypothetical protein
MKKLTILLQIVGLLALCPLYVILEITHSPNENPEPGSGLLIKPKTGIMSARDSKIPQNKTQSTSSYSNTK